MKTIWKFPFEISDELIVYMPNGADVIHIAVQKEQPCIWAIVDPKMHLVPFKFHLHGTGHPFTGEEGLYVGSFQMLGGDLVSHLFADKEEGGNGKTT